MFGWFRSFHARKQVESLIARLPFRDECTATIQRLGELGRPEAIQPLKSHVRLSMGANYSPGNYPREWMEAAAVALAKLGAREVLPTLFENLLLAQTPDERDVCLFALKAFGWQAPEDPEQEVIYAIFSGRCPELAQRGARALPHLRKALRARLQSGDRDEQWEPLARTLVQLDDAKADSSFLEALTGPNPGIRARAATVTATVDPQSQLGQALPERRAQQIETGQKKIVKAEQGPGYRIAELSRLVRLGDNGVAAARRAVQALPEEEQHAIANATGVVGWPEIMFLLDKLPPKRELPPAKVLPHFACGYCHAEVRFPLESSAFIQCEPCKRKLRLRCYATCPRCRGAPRLKEDLVGGTAASIVGGLLLGGVGAVIGKAVGGQVTCNYCCQKCGHLWGIELLEQSDY